MTKRGSNWVLAFTDVDGRRRRTTLGADKRIAERRRQQIINRRNMQLDGLGAVEGQTLLLTEILDLYLQDLRPRVSPAHFTNVESRLRHVLDQLDGVRVRDLRTTDLTRIRSRATADGASNRTANLLVDRVRGMLGWAEEAGIIAASPVARIKRLPESADHRRYRRRALTEEEIAAFLAQSREDDTQCEILWDYPRVPQTIWWRCLLETAARYGELRQVTWGDVDLKRRVLVLRPETTKSKKQRSIPLRDELVAELTRLKAYHETVLGRLPMMHDHVFLAPEGRPWPKPSTNPNRILRRLLERAGIPRVNAQGEKIDIHALRTTAASRMARNGIPLVMAQRMLGHSDPKLTAQAYTSLDVEDLRKAVEHLPGLSVHERTKEAR